MKRALRYVLILFLILILFASCRPDITNPEEGKELRTWEEVFTAWYDGMTRNYLFWESDFESLDWASLYDEYLPRFRSYGNFGGEHQTEGLFDLYEIIQALTDGHYYAVFYKTDGTPMFYFLPSEIRAMKRFGLTDDDIFSNSEKVKLFNRSDYMAEDTLTVLEHTFGVAQEEEGGGLSIAYSATKEGSKAFKYFSSFGAVVLPSSDAIEPRFSMILGKTHDDILYLAFSGYEIKKIITDAESDNPESLYSSNVKALFENYLEEMAGEMESGDNISGLIIDLRGNGGGDVDDINNVFSILTDTEIHYGDMVFKTSGNPGSYSVAHEMFLHGSGKRFEKPVVLITNSLSASSAELSVMAMRAMREDNLIDFKQVGGLTIGATSVIYPGAFESGSFDIENIISEGGNEYVFSISTQNSLCSYRDGTRYDAVGLEPDVAVDFSYESFIAGIDGRLVRALEVLRDMQE